MKNPGKKFLMSCMFIFTLCLFAGINASAADVYNITKTEGVITGTKNNSAMINVYVCIKKVGGAYTVVKPCTADSSIYYFDKNGKGKVYKKSSFIKITYNGTSNTYYSNSKGVLQTNKIVGSKKLGYYYVDPNGIRIKSTAAVKAANKKAAKKGKYSKTNYNAQCIEYAVKFVRAHGGSGSNSAKLKRCFLYLSSHYKYRRSYTNLYPNSAIMDDFAYDMFTSKAGNCHRYAAAFAYIARVLGFDSMTVTGETTSNSGGWTPHGWNKIKVGSKWYVCDPDMQMMGYSSYMKTSTPSRTRNGKSHRLYAKNGKVYWK